MFLIRSVRAGDFKSIYRLAKKLNSYNLPADTRRLQEIIRCSVKSFHGQKLPIEKKQYLFVIENARSHNVVGCSLVIARHGTPRLPHLAFGIGSESLTSKTLHKTIRHQTLKLIKDTRGYTEIGGLVTLPEYRRHKERLGKQLSFARFLYMKQHRSQFCPKVLVEYFPKLSGNKGNQFWKTVGHQFTGLSYDHADKLSINNKEFIMSLFPKTKLYCCLLRDGVAKHLGEPGPGGKISLYMLEKMGFRFLNQIDPFDGGPNYGIRFSQISAIQKTLHLKHREGAILKSSKAFLVMAEESGQVRICVSQIKKMMNEVCLPAQTIDLLQIKPKQRVSVTPF